MIDKIRSFYTKFMLFLWSLNLGMSVVFSGYEPFSIYRCVWMLIELSVITYFFFEE